MSLDEVTIDYTNYRGERASRKIWPRSIFFGSNEWHPERQWLLTAFDVEKQQGRIFAMKDIHSWTPTAPSQAGEMRSEETGNG